MPEMVIESNVTGEALSRVMAAKELLRLERRIARAEVTLRILETHRERLLGLIGGSGNSVASAPIGKTDREGG